MDFMSSQAGQQVGAQIVAKVFMIRKKRKDLENNIKFLCNIQFV